MSQPFYQVDAFADRPFTGNPAAVCLLDHEPDPSWMQAVAAEMNLSETAFLWPEPEGFRLRWFTPTVEVDLCGHATLATAHLLWELGRLPESAPARFSTRSGPLTARLDGDRIVLDFPACPPEPIAVPAWLPESLRADVLWAGQNGMDVLGLVESEAVVRGLKPDLGRIAAQEARGLIVTAPAVEPGIDFVSRFFAPSCGVPEDPVTGSAHCALGPFWADRLGRAQLVGYQASARGGRVGVEVVGDRVHLSGRATTVIRGELLDGPVSLK